MASSKFSLPFVHHTQIAKDTYSFYFDRTKVPEFEFLPGQYIRMILPHENVDDRGTSRYFTIASSPLKKDHLMITTKVIQSTFKKTLFGLESGQEVSFFGPLGSFILDEQEASPRIYLAGGIGLTPFHSMLTYSAGKNVLIPQTLFVSFSAVEEMVFYQELSQIHEENSNLSAIYTITHPAESAETWEGETGRISEEMLKRHVNLTGKELYFICGPSAMVDAMREMIMKMGISEEQIQIEHFSGY